MRAARTGRRPRPGDRSVASRLARAALVTTTAALLAGSIGLAAVVARGVSGSGAPPDFAGPLPARRAADVLAVHRDPADWERTLLDPTYTLEPDDNPRDLVPVEEAGLAGRGSIRLVAVVDLRRLARAARADGVRLRVRSAFRSYDDQIRTIASLERSYGRDWAVRSAARPGHSEHQLGTTFDLDGDDDWLAANAWRHGFVVSYPPERSPAFTCSKAEPWHVRYLDRPVAAAVHESGLSLREWLWLHAEDVR